MCLSGLVFVLLLALCIGWMRAHLSELRKTTEMHVYEIMSVFVNV